MTRRHALIRRLRRNKRGVAMVEFALTAPVFLLLLMGIFDYCWQMYAQQVLQGAVSKAGRDSTLEQFATNQKALDDRVKAQVLNVFNHADVTFTRKAYDTFDQVGTEERYTDDKPKNGRYDPGECFDDFNKNGRWDRDRGRDSNGTAGDVVLYTASMKFKRVLPVWYMLGQPQETTLSSSTVLRNQPFANGTDAPPDECK
ncbi:TadE/TadG family type IV pilus assembly protein [Sphingopyxis macrogoltabida]|uniref:Pilus assembly protein TadE n=1 Tax=Sphingopyxis macrogoltabida TaxID=33050 RepID=A0A0N9U9V1_SPHMC|nr:TadE family protein [Sphingopyxis macrogoltabida]ALH82142.1 pilus assembly protein TadE [Sphingopyxis macrogoltabida]